MTSAIEKLGLVIPASAPVGGQIQVRRILPDGQVESFGSLTWPERKQMSVRNEAVAIGQDGAYTLVPEDYSAWYDRCVAWAERRWAWVA